MYTHINTQWYLDSVLKLYSALTSSVSLVSIMFLGDDVPVVLAYNNKVFSWYEQMDAILFLSSINEYFIFALLFINIIWHWFGISFIDGMGVTKVISTKITQLSNFCVGTLPY